MSLATQRHSTLTANLANVNTPGYKRKDVDFNLTLEEAIGESKGAGRFNSNHSPISNENNIRLDGNNVDLEKEVMALAETELRYQALTDLTAGYFAGMKNVIREGR
jgi:flagellar basal-body rod protein FlgB